MKRTDIERIIKQGSVRQKIKLYMTDIALLNVDFENLDYEITGKELNIKGSKLLSNKESELLWSSIKDPKDVKYYNELTKWNSAFLLFKDKLSIEVMKLQALFYHICIYNAEETIRGSGRDLVNEILDLIPDKKLREKVLNKAVELTKEDGGLSSTQGEIYQEKGSPKYLDISRSGFWRDIKRPTEVAITTAKVCKQYIAMFRAVLNSNLPLKPYKDWVDEQEKKLKTLIEAIYNTTILEDTPPDFPIIERYEDIEAIITDEDIEDFKSSGL
jgi:hypothetical protein